MARGDAAKIKALRIPRWANRATDVKIKVVKDPATGVNERVAVLDAPLPARFRRKDVLRIRAKRRLRTRLRYVKTGRTLEVTGGQHPDGSRQLSFYLVVKTGSIIIHERRSRRRKRRRLTIGGSAILRPDADLTKAFDQKYWRAG